MNPVAVPPGPLTDQERSQLDYFDAAIEERAARAGAQAWFEVALAGASPKVAVKVKEAWEARDRRVGVFEAPGGYRLVVSPCETRGLPAVRAVTSIAVPTSGRRLLVRVPTRGRPAQALRTLAAYRQMAGIPITIEVVLDEDDLTMLAADVLQRLLALGCVVTVGPHRSKVEACNAGRVRDWDVLVLGSDDMVPVVDGYAKRIVEEMERHFPHLDGALHLFDGYADEYVTLPVLGRRLYDQFSYVYEPGYRSLWCDREMTEVLRGMGRLARVHREALSDVLVEHQHPAAGKAPFDSTYAKNEAVLAEDFEYYEARRDAHRPHAQMGFDAPPLWLSVLITTIASRRAQLDRLLDHLYAQIAQDASREVEVLVEPGETLAIGAKRQALLGRARGHFVAFVDDDDFVSHDYVRRIVSVIRETPEADCLALWGEMTENAGRPERFHHSLVHAGWFTDGNGVHRRTPNHLNPVRREHALAAGFPEHLSHGEDFEYARRVRPLLKNEASTGEAPLYFYFYSDEA